MVNHGVPFCLGARNVITKLWWISVMYGVWNRLCHGDLGQRTMFLINARQNQGLKTSRAVCHWDCPPKQKRIMIFLIRWSRCAIGENQLQGLLQGPTLRHCAMLFWVKTEDMQGLKRLGVMALSMGTYMDGWKSVGNQLFFLEIIRYING